MVSHVGKTFQLNRSLKFSGRVGVEVIVVPGSEKKLCPRSSYNSVPWEVVRLQLMFNLRNSKS